MIEYDLYDPSGNITVLIPAAGLQDCDQKTASHIMQCEPMAEQAGFVLPGSTDYDIRLQMAGGEFCGNASLSTAALYCMRQRLRTGERMTVRLKVSGAPHILTADMTALDAQGCYMGRLTMPEAESIETMRLPLPEAGMYADVPVVRVPGIVHTILPESFGKAAAEACIRSWCEILRADGLGIMLVDENCSRITPLVYIPASDTLFFEHSCASGSAATGAWLAEKNREYIRRVFHEPGGDLAVEANPGGHITLEGNAVFRKHCTIE